MNRRKPLSLIEEPALERFAAFVAAWLMRALAIALKLAPKGSLHRNKRLRPMVMGMRRVVIAILMQRAARRIRGQIGGDYFRHAHGMRHTPSRNSNRRLVSGSRVRRLLHGRSLEEQINALIAALKDGEDIELILAKRMRKGMSCWAQRISYKQLFALALEDARQEQAAAWDSS